MLPNSLQSSINTLIKPVKIEELPEEFWHKHHHLQIAIHGKGTLACHP